MVELVVLFHIICRIYVYGSVFNILLLVWNLLNSLYKLFLNRVFPNFLFFQISIDLIFAEDQFKPGSVMVRGGNYGSGPFSFVEFACAPWACMDFLQAPPENHQRQFGV